MCCLPVKSYKSFLNTGSTVRWPTARNRITNIFSESLKLILSQEITSIDTTVQTFTSFSFNRENSGVLAVGLDVQCLILNRHIITRMCSTCRYSITAQIGTCTHIPNVCYRIVFDRPLNV